MTESQFTSKLLRALKQHLALRDALVWKVSDRFAAGRPDVQVILNGVTTYFEIKVAPYKLTKIQSWTLERIGWLRAHVVQCDEQGLMSVSDSEGIFQARSWTFSLDDIVSSMIRACNRL